MLLLRWIFCPADLLALDADRDALVAMPCLSVPCCALLCEAFIILAYSFCLARSGAWFASIWMHVLLFFPTASFIVSFFNSPCLSESDEAVVGVGSYSPPS